MMMNHQKKKNFQMKKKKIQVKKKNQKRILLRKKIKEIKLI